ncbi:MAG: glycosyltransferase family 4 protein [Thermoanaerobaculia bacterium]
MEKLRIAQVAPLYESVPPKLYGGTERIVSYLTEELVRQGHEVTLFASGDSVTRARLVAACPRSLRLDPGCVDSLAHHLVLIEEVFRRAESFDVLHFHVDYLHFPVTRRLPVPHLTTLHGRLDIPDLVPLHREYQGMPVTSISDAQRAPLPWLNWRGTIHHGLPADLHRGIEEPQAYLAFLGRVSPEKGLDRAIEIARRAGLPLRVAAKVDKADLAYYEEVIEPLLAQPHVDFLGEIGEAEKQRFLGNARAVLFPIDWPEPFGLVMIEAMACGTPVIAFRRGSVPEVLDEGETGFVVSTIEEAVEAVGRLDEISRRGCREAFERRFTARRMAQDYVRIYRQQIERGSHGREDHADPGAVLHPGHQLAPR